MSHAPKKTTSSISLKIYFSKINYAKLDQSLNLAD